MTKIFSSQLKLPGLHQIDIVHILIGDVGDIDLEDIDVLAPNEV